ncbi:MAG: glycine--tRNA ligase subunit beta [Nitrospirae bacterium]|nr:glycine--tRNA ligase subunit beta [Nitrospirota bacterium]
MNRDLLIEIGAEEIPARFMPATISAIKDAAERLFRENRLQYKDAVVYATPRRVALIIRELHDRQEDIAVEVSGPPRNIAYDSEGRPTKAAAGFAKGQGIDVSSLKIKKTDKGEYVYAEISEKGKLTIDILPSLLQHLLCTITFPKSMRWNSTRARFARPIRWILALYGDNPVPVEFAGLKSGRLSYGHHFMSPSPFTVNGVDDYPGSLEERFVIVDQTKRRRLIEDQLKDISKEKGGIVIVDEELLEEVTFLTEYPVAVCGRFDDEFLILPKDVLITVMREHQRSFSIEGERGESLPYFISVSNTMPKRLDVVRAGYEKVIRARLSDAKFFFSGDCKTRLERQSERLKQVVFMAGLGTMWDKVERLERLTGKLAPLFGWPEITAPAERAAGISKADLMTEMVGEFPELQGVMGREYARRQGEEGEVAMAIFEHYLPRFAVDKLPSTKCGKILAVADKIDNIVGCFGTANIPSSSYDPYALRRQALGILHILIKGGHHISLRKITESALSIYGDIIPVTIQREVLESVMEFFRERLNTLLVSEGYRYDCVRSVILAGLDDPFDAFLRISALDRFRMGTEFDSLIISFKRVMNIIPPDFPPDFKVGLKEELLKEKEEKGLYQVYKDRKRNALLAKGEHDYEKAFACIAELKPHVDLFFDKVLVMDKDMVLRNNRLSLLNNLKELFLNFADFTQIVVEGKT